MPIQGFTRLRKHQLARQAVFGTAVAATRAYPLQGVPTANLNWTDPEGDFGSIDPIAPPYRGIPDLGGTPTAPILNYNDLVAFLSAFFGGAVSPTGGGAAQTWAFQPQSLAADDFDSYTHEFGDDVLTDWFQFRDGILTDLEISGENQGPLTASLTWKYGHVASTGSTDSPVDGTVPTADLSVDAHAIPIFLKDLGISIDSDPSNIGGTPIIDALHSFRLRFHQDVDEKRFANASQEYELNGYGRGARSIELECTYAKTADTVGTGSESDAWMSDTAVDRYVQIAATSKALLETGPDVPYSWVTDMPMRYYTRSDGEIGGNSTVVLMGKQFYEAETLEYAIESTVVCALTEAELGEVS